MAYEEIQVTKLVSDIEGRRLAVPEFQRSFEWDYDDRLEMLRTLLRDWPSGAVLLLKAGQTLDKLSFRELTGGPEIGLADKENIKYLVLDGQQRLTSVYCALRDHDSHNRYYVDLAQLDPDGDFEDDAVQFIKREDYPSQVDAAKKLWVRMDEIFSEVKWEEWLSFLSSKEKERAELIYQTHLAPARLYNFPALVLDDDLKLGSLVRVFAKLNRQGEPLSTFDLIVALMLPLGFKLRDKEKAAKDVCSELVSGYGATGVGMNILKTVAMLQRARQIEEGHQDPVAGIGEENIIDMVEDSPAIIDERWDEAVALFAKALELLATKCGSVRKNLLPPDGMIISVAAALGAPDARPGWEADLERWVWMCWFDQSYARTTNSRARLDLDELRKWAKDSSYKPYALKNLDSTPEKVALSLRSEQRSNGMFRKGLMALLIAHGAKDWYKTVSGGTQLLSEWTKPIEFHHIYPEQYLQDHNLPLDVIVNFTPIKSATNQSLRSDTPSAVVSSSRVDKSTFLTHFIEHEEFAKNSEGFDAVLAYRTKHILELIASKTGLAAIAE